MEVGTDRVGLKYVWGGVIREQKARRRHWRERWDSNTYTHTYTGHLWGGRALLWEFLLELKWQMGILGGGGFVQAGEGLISTRHR